MTDSVGWLIGSTVGSGEGLKEVASIIEPVCAAHDWARVWTCRAVSSATILLSCASSICMFHQIFQNSWCASQKTWRISKWKFIWGRLKVLNQKFWAQCYTIHPDTWCFIVCSKVTLNLQRINPRKIHFWPKGVLEANSQWPWTQMELLLFDMSRWRQAAYKCWQLNVVIGHHVLPIGRLFCRWSQELHQARNGQVCWRRLEQRGCFFFFKLLLLLETVVQNPWLRVYVLKSMWIW